MAQSPSRKEAMRQVRGAEGMDGVWWTKFGAASMDFSHQERMHPSDTIFKNVVAHKRWDAEAMSRPAPLASRELRATQIRHPAPATEALAPTKASPDLERKFWAHAVTSRQSAIRLAEKRQRRIDVWAGEAPIRLAPDARREWSESSLSAASCSQVSREVYRRNGFLVGRTQAPVRAKSLSLQSILFAGEVMKAPPMNVLRKRPRQYEMGWKTLPERRFVFDPKSFLPVPRGGWDLNDTSWPDIIPAGRRGLAPLPCDSHAEEAVEPTVGPKS
ncbi:unnamed protein product [Symbiodinium pilosum]|uniref:Uncharacterized protein n=1 Tax=Symbiodinium pilosum TaxID=2952 RepID=A0A812RVH7_SYMPI|nr:unnamed protein product [Symbiodinium pilosum]